MSLPPLQLSLQFSAEHTQRLDPVLHLALSRHRVARAVRHALKAALAHPKLQSAGLPTATLPALIGVRVVGQDEGLSLNEHYRKKAYATNVLTFAYALAPQIWADVVLCAPVLVREALELGVSLQSHCTHLLVHASLHALGFDHELGPRQAKEMESLEISILKDLGIADPYKRSTPNKAPPQRRKVLRSNSNAS